MQSIPPNFAAPGAGRVTGLSHMGITVSNLDQSLRFYCDVLGLEQRTRWTRTEDYIGRLVGYPGVTIHAAVLCVPGTDHLVELVQYSGVERTSIDPASANPATAHLSLNVVGLGTFARQLEANGVQLIGEPVSPTVGPNKGGLALYVLDPDGMRVELTESPLRLDDVEPDERAHRP